MKYHCLKCDYKWISRKTFGTPAKCPSCNCKAITEFLEFTHVTSNINLDDCIYRLLSDSHDWNREAAASVLGTFKDTKAVNALIKALSDDNAGVRESAARSLGNVLGTFKDTKAVNALIKALSDDNAGVRESAARGLGKAGDRKAVLPLIKVLQDKNLLVIRSAAKSLGKLGDKKAVETLKSLEKDPFIAKYPYIAEVVKEALSKIHVP